MSNRLRIIGDVHGLYNRYSDIALEAEKKGMNTVQVGDMGFSYEHFKKFGLKAPNHRFFGGNHDNYDKYKKSPNALGDFGFVDVPNWSYNGFFFVRGAYSIDKVFRTPGIDWWDKEELSYRQLMSAVDDCRQCQPSVILTHDCPNSVKDILGEHTGWDPVKTRTGDALEGVLESCKPSLWIFGHWHRHLEIQVTGVSTRFVCLAELDYMDV